MDPSNPNVLFAASHSAPPQFRGASTAAGPAAPCGRQIDGGKKWTKLTGNGLPDNPIIGRIGIDIARSKPATIYASFEVGAERRHRRRRQRRRHADAAGQARRWWWRWRTRRSERPRPPPDSDEERHLAIRRRRQDVAVRQSNDGDRWMYYSQMRIDPTNPEIAYQGGAPFFKTVDGGKTWRQVQGIPHSDHHARSGSIRRTANHILLGNDGGLDVTLRPGRRRGDVNTVPRRPVLRGQRRHAEALLASAAACRTTAAGVDRARTRSANGHPELRLVPRRRRRRLLHRRTIPPTGRSSTRVAGRRHTSRIDLRAGRSVQHPAVRAAVAGGRRAQPAGPRGADPATVQAPAAQFGGLRRQPERRTSCRPPRPARTTGSTGTRRSSCRRTIRARSISACERLRSGRITGAKRGWHRPTSRTTSAGTTGPIMGVDGKAPMASKHDGAASYSNIITIGESPSCPA